MQICKEKYILLRNRVPTHQQVKIVWTFHYKKKCPTIMGLKGIIYSILTNVFVSSYLKKRIIKGSGPKM